jgi:hypothetical protein
MTLRAGQFDGPSSAPPLNASEIVERMTARNQQRAGQLQHYTDDRYYHVEYHGFPKGQEASMEVHKSFDAPATKRFHVISKTGSKFLIDRVLIKLLQSEADAANDQSRTALTTTNYAFELLGIETTSTGQHFYVLAVRPKVHNKYLFRGKVWVDTEEYAVAIIDAEPAENPSFLIRKTRIHYIYSKVGDFWLPMRSESESKIRFGGTATLTINYTHYEILDAEHRALPAHSENRK